ARDPAARQRGGDPDRRSRGEEPRLAQREVGDAGGELAHGDVSPTNASSSSSRRSAAAGATALRPKRTRSSAGRTATRRARGAAPSARASASSPISSSLVLLGARGSKRSST